MDADDISDNGNRDNIEKSADYPIFNLKNKTPQLNRKIYRPKVVIEMSTDCSFIQNNEFEMELEKDTEATKGNENE